MFSSGYAVVIGVGADLPVTIKDATAVSNQLSDTQRCAYPAEQVKLLTGEKAAKADILNALKWLAEKTGLGDTAVVYFSGHGIEKPNFHLIPYGFDWNNLAGTAITQDEFSTSLRAIQAERLLVLLDCCHAAGQATAKEPGGLFSAKSPMPTAAIAELGQSSGRVVIASSRKDEVSWTGDPYSVFTMAVLEAIAGYGAFEKDGYARVLDLALWVGRVIPERTNDKQHPIIKVSNLKDNFALAWYAGGESQPKALPWKSVVSTGQHFSDDRQIASWNRMLANYRENLLLIEERMSEYVEFNTIPLLLVRERRRTDESIADLERKLG